MKIRSLAVVIAASLGTAAFAAPEDDVKATFDNFVAAQNAHDAAAVRALLVDAPDFLWITRGNVVWGRDAAMKRFEANYAGTWKLAPKFPDIWAAIAPISGSGAPDTLDKVRNIPQIIVHGDADPTVAVTGSRNMVAKLKELGTEHKYIEVPGGLHSDVVAPNLAAIVEFFNAHKKSVKASSL